MVDTSGKLKITLLYSSIAELADNFCSNFLYIFKVHLCSFMRLPLSNSKGFASILFYEPAHLDLTFLLWRSREKKHISSPFFSKVAPPSNGFSFFFEVLKSPYNHVKKNCGDLCGKYGKSYYF